MVGFRASAARVHRRVPRHQQTPLPWAKPAAVTGRRWRLPIPDVLRTDLLVVIGANPIISHGKARSPLPRIKGPHARHRQNAVGRVLVIDPRKTRDRRAVRVAGHHFPTATPTCCCRCCTCCSARTSQTRAHLARPGRRRSLAGTAGPGRFRPPKPPEARTGIDPDTGARNWARDSGPHAGRAAVLTARVGTSTGEKRHAHNVFTRRGSTWWRAILTSPGGSMFGSFGIAGGALGDEGARCADAHQANTRQAVPDRRLYPSVLMCPEPCGA